MISFQQLHGGKQILREKKISTKIMEDESATGRALIIEDGKILTLAQPPVMTTIINCSTKGTKKIVKEQQQQQ